MTRPAWPGLKAQGANRPILGRQLCNTCGRWRPVSDFDVITEWVTRKVVLRHRCQACRRIAQRDLYRQRGPEQVMSRQEYERIYREVQRRAEGIPPRQWRRRVSVIDKPEYRYLPALPLLREMRAVDNWEGIARKAGVPARTIFRLRIGESAHVRLDVADKLAVALGLELELIYHGEPLVRIGYGHNGTPV